MMTRQVKFIAAIVLQVMIIFIIIIFKVSILAGGTDIMLRIEPVDPRDPLRGDYVTFQYEISNVYAYYARNSQIKNGDTVYVILRQYGKYWIAQGVQKTKPVNEEFFIKGKVQSGGSDNQNLTSPNQRNGNYNLHIVYGIEQYFIPEGKGQNFSFWDKEAAARVAVDENGNVALKQIYIDNKLWP